MATPTWNTVVLALMCGVAFGGLHMSFFRAWVLLNLANQILERVQLQIEEEKYYFISN